MEPKLNLNQSPSTQLKAPDDIIRYLDSVAVGQPEYKLALASELFLQHHRYLRYRAGEEPQKIGRKANLLAVGGTGTGKTYIAERAAASLSLPFFIEDVTHLGPTGSGARTVGGLPARILRQAGDDIDRAQFSVCLLDEVDKLAQRPHVQVELLRIIEGTTVSLRVRGRTRQFRTHNILFLATGAFHGMVEPDPTSTDPGSDELLNLANFGPKRSIDEEAIIKFGLLPEVLGRLRLRVRLNDWGLGGLRRLLVAPHGPVSELRELCLDFGVHLDVTEDAVFEMANLALESKLGGRALDSCLEPIRRAALAVLPTAHQRGLRTLRVDRGLTSTWTEDGAPLQPRIDRWRFQASDLTRAHSIHGDPVSQFFTHRLPRTSGQGLARLDDLSDLFLNQPSVSHEHERGV